jgi:hypothetical protein
MKTAPKETTDIEYRGPSVLLASSSRSPPMPNSLRSPMCSMSPTRHRSMKWSKPSPPNITASMRVPYHLSDVRTSDSILNHYSMRSTARALQTLETSVIPRARWLTSHTHRKHPSKITRLNL